MAVGQGKCSPEECKTIVINAGNALPKRSSKSLSNIPRLPPELGCVHSDASKRRLSGGKKVVTFLDQSTSWVGNSGDFAPSHLVYYEFTPWEETWRRWKPGSIRSLDQRRRDFVLDLLRDREQSSVLPSKVVDANVLWETRYKHEITSMSSKRLSLIHI